MENDFYFNLLEKLSKNGIYRPLDISEDLKSYFRRNTPELIEEVWFSSGHDLVDELLESIKKENYIEYQNKTEKGRLIYDKNWVDKLSVSATLTTKGLLFLYEKKRMDESRKGNNLTRIFIAITGAIGLMTCVVAIVSLKSNDDFDIQLKSLLQTHIKQQEILIEKLQSKPFQPTKENSSKTLPQTKK